MLLVAPVIIVLFTDHWYEGADPPLVDAEVKSTVVPEHTVSPGAAEILKEGTTTALTVTTVVIVQPVDNV